MVSEPSSPTTNAPPGDTRSAPADSPSRGERIFTTLILALFGIAFGLGLFTFTYAKGFSYLSNDPAACVNCHIMRDQYEGWNHSSHKAVATCNDCHTPHRFPDKWVIKGVNGFNHSVAFTTGNFPEPIQIRGFNARIAQENCVDCHATTVSEMHLFTSDQELDCVACHSNVGHNNAAPNGVRNTLPTLLMPVPVSGINVPEADAPEKDVPETDNGAGGDPAASEGVTPEALESEEEQ